MSKVTAHIDCVTLTYDFPEYSPSVTYHCRNVVTYNGQLYNCIAETSGDWKPSHWQAVTLEWLIDDELGLNEKPSE